jgi:hypothetical protein
LPSTCFGLVDSHPQPQPQPLPVINIFKLLSTLLSTFQPEN